jgi:hypothetical protein
VKPNLGFVLAATIPGPAALRQTCFGLRTLHYRDGDRARQVATSISSFPGGRPGHAALFHFEVPGGKWHTVMSRPAVAASLASSTFHSRLR